jgi:adenosine deaminase
MGCATRSTRACASRLGLTTLSPQAELHLHLQGAILPATLFGLARRHGVALPVDDLPALREWFRFRDFAHFVEVYALLRACLVEPADFELVTFELGSELADQGVRYAEVTFTPGPEVYRGPRETFFDGLTAGRERVGRELGVELRWIFDIPRRTVTLRIWGALRALGAERLGHGVRCVEDPGLLEYLVEQRIPLEVCPTSNIALGVYPSLAEHPLPRLVQAGAVVTINTDTPAIFGTTLTAEAQLLRTEFGLSDSAAEQILQNAVDASFSVPPTP